MILPDLRNFDLKGKKVLLRVDLDVPLEKINNLDGSFEYKVIDETRLEDFIPTLKLILEKGVKTVAIIGHIGRYEGEGKGISTFCLWPTISKLAGETTSFWPTITGNLDPKESRIHLMENLRMFKGEEENDLEFARKLATHGDFYINEAFATSHREHASIVSLPKLLPHAAGLRLINEVENLTKLMKDSKKPVVFVFGGVKKDKLENLPGILKWIDKVLIGGKFPELIDDNLKNNPKVIVGSLTADGTDIDSNTIETFKKEISQAGTIIFAGPMGKYEEREDGTKEIIRAIVESSAYKVAGGGDTESAISKFGFDGKFDFISSGGGAMLEYLAQGDLPGLKALRN